MDSGTSAYKIRMLPKSLKKLIEELQQLPGVGPRSAERYALSLLERDEHTSQRLASALKMLHQGVGRCKVTHVFTEPGQEISEHYEDENRDKRSILVVADPFDVIAMEKIGEYNGTYHVLGGLISPLDNVHPEHLTISSLINRIHKDDVTELIIATNASVEGESTAMYIKNQLADKPDVRISRLARGIPVGVDIEYTDQLTLSRALANRQDI